jgi:hypothetical protein
MTGNRNRPKRKDPNQIGVKAKPGEDEAVAVARTALRPTVQAALTLREYGKGFTDLDLTGLIDSLTEQTNATTAGDLGRAEAMLTTQAHTLDAIFHNLARRASMNMGEYLRACETYLKLALRAQSQCRATWEALAEMKQPHSVAFVGQANISHGHQQVNNAAPRDREIENTQIKVLEQSDGERLDTRTTSTAGGADTPLETVGARDRAKNAGRQSASRAER